MEDHSTHGSPPSSQRLKSNLITDTGTFQLSLQLIMENHSTYVSSPSQKLESYEITDIVIGRGSYGVVYEAIEKTTGQKFAVKVTKKINLNPEDLIRNQTEAENLKLLHHSNILKFHDFIEDSSRFYLFTEIVNGGELFDRIVENDGFSEIEAKAIIHKILLAVDHCHKNGIVHRDIKAENILLVNENDNDTDFDLRLIDFGFAVKADGTSLFGELGD
jgi:serine/threonine protein kinase